MSDNLLEIKNLSIVLKKDNKIKSIVKNINISCKKEEKIAIVGESGSGKTTIALSILNILNKNIKIDKGNIFFKNKDILKLKEDKLYNLRGKEISIIFQDTINSLNHLIKVGPQILEVAQKHLNINKKEGKILTLEIMKKIGFEKPEIIYNNYPYQLSGGMRQRILIASAIICNPSLLIADEPTSSLDIIVKKQIIDILNNLVIKNKMAMIFISHDLITVNLIVDYIYVIYKGYIVEQGNKVDIIKNYRHPYTKLLIENIVNKENIIDKKNIINKENKKTSEIINNNIKLQNRCPFLNKCKYTIEKCFKSFPNYEKIDEKHFSLCFNKERKN